MPGDLNCDSVIDLADINPFVLALVDEGEYGSLYPWCRWLNADCNGDGQVGFDDIDAFVNILVSRLGLRLDTPLGGGPAGLRALRELGDRSHH